MNDAPCFLIRRPDGPLSRHVEMLWYWRSTTPGHTRDRMMPSGTASLVINLAEDAIRIYDLNGGRLERQYEGASFSGAGVEPFVIDTAEQAHVAGVAFRPGGAFPFGRHAQDELLDVHAPLRDVWSLEVASLRERLLVAPTPHAALAVLEHALLAQLTRPLGVHHGVQAMLRRIARDPSARIRTVCRDLPLSGRRLARLFELEVGMTPKLYARLLRFRQLRDLIHARPSVDWAEIAQDCGYFDQPHLVRDFKAFSGFTPTEYLRLATDASNHVPIG